MRDKKPKETKTFRVDSGEFEKADKLCRKKKTTIRKQLQKRVDEIVENPETIKS